MSTFEITMPKMGESVEEATITKWFVKPGDKVEEDDPILEIATDKVDSEIPSPVAGTVKELFFDTDEVVAVGKAVALIDLGDEGEKEESEKEESEEGEEEKSEGGNGQDQETTGEKTKAQEKPEEKEEKEEKAGKTKETETASKETKKDEEDKPSGDRFYSPLVRNIAQKEGISFR
ncbi:MAG: biotin/lipoyl-containing protein, partial [Marinilabiliaceae bacterium]